MLHKSLGPCHSNFSAMPAHIPQWWEFWPWQADLASWLDFRPASSLQTCLPILAPGWSQLLSLDLLCSHCWDAKGLCWWELYPAHSAAVSAPDTFPYTAVQGKTLLSVWSVVCVQQRHLDPPTLISQAIMTWQKQTWWGPEASLCSVQICVFDSQSHWGEPNNI